MIHDKEILKSFSSYLFWDVDKNEVDLVKHSKFIVERVVTRGNLDDLRLLLKIYDREVIVDNVTKVRTLDKKTLNFLVLFFNIAKEEFRCYS